MVPEIGEEEQEAMGIAFTQSSFAGGGSGVENSTPAEFALKPFELLLQSWRTKKRYCVFANRPVMACGLTALLITVPPVPAVAPVPGVVKVADGPYSTMKVPVQPKQDHVASAPLNTTPVAATPVGVGQAGGGGGVKVNFLPTRFAVEETALLAVTEELVDGVPGVTLWIPDASLRPTEAEGVPTGAMVGP